jgi:hypothetical protein
MTPQPDPGPIQGEISYDLVMDDDMPFVEGTYRLGSGEWKVFIFLMTRTAGEMVWNHSTWDSGVGGIVFQVPSGMPLNMATVEALMSKALGCGSWRRVVGPDSMVLR